MKKITILLTEDHDLIREGYALILDCDPRFQVIAQARTSEEAIEMTNERHPDIVLMDINLPGISGIEAIGLIKKISPLTKVIGVSMHTQPSIARKMLQKGAKGYVTKCSSSNELRKAIVEAYNNRRYVCKTIKNNIANRFASDQNNQVSINSLSSREMEIVEFVRKGFTSKEIASCLQVCRKTVEAHRYNILKKLKIKNTPALIAYINATGLAA